MNRKLNCITDRIYRPKSVFKGIETTDDDAMKAFVRNHKHSYKNKKRREYGKQDRQNRLGNT